MSGGEVPANALEALMGRIGRVAVALGIGLLTFWLADRASRLVLSSRAPLEKRFPVGSIRQPRPYTMFGGLPHGKGLNRLGYPGPAPAPEKPAGEVRVVFLGGSTVFEGEPPIPARVEELLRQRGLDAVRCYNFGVVSSVSGQEVARIVFEVADLRADAVIMYNGGNDILQPWSWDPRPGYPFNFVAYEQNPLLESELPSYPTGALAAYGSNLCRVAFSSWFVDRFTQLEHLRKEQGWNTDEWRARIAADYLGNVRKASAISNAFGARFMAFFQPTLYYRPQLAEEEKLLAAGQNEKAVHTRDVRRRVQQDAPSLAGIPFVDLSGAFDGISGRVFYDDIHTSQEAKDLIAGRIATALVEAGLGERPSGALP